MFSPRGGYAGRLLRVNLTARTITEERPNPQVQRDFIGGMGIGTKILYDEVDSGIKPFDPDNRLIFGTGPLNGTLAPGSGTFSVVTKSPLTGLACAAQSNGFLGARLKFSGYDTIIVEGASDKFVYLHINNGSAEIKDAQELVGHDTWKTESILKERYGNRASVACVGTAGENLVRFAVIYSDNGHIAASGGVGAVMGSKGLKAIVVQGNMSVPLPDGSQDKLRELSQKWVRRIKESPFCSMLSSSGTAGLFSIYHNQGWVPVENLTTNLFPNALEFDGRYIREHVYKKVKPLPCYRCPLSHCSISEVLVGPYKGLITEEAEYESLAGWGPNVGISEPGTAIKLSHVTDCLGVDAKESTFLISLLMECYAKGTISNKDLDGIELSWGNADGIIQILEKIATREGVGNMLAEGVMRVSEQIGKEAPDLAVYVKKGQAPHVHDLRTRWGTLFTQAISNTGSQEGIDLTLNVDPDLGIDEPIPDPDERLPKAQAKTGPRRQFEETLIVCYFLARGQGSLNNIIDTLNVVTGFDLNVGEALRIGHRIINLLRVFNIKHGWALEDDFFSPRLGEMAVDGPQAGKSMAGPFESLRRIYYKEMGWGENTGIPLPQTLKKLGLEYTVNDMERHGLKNDPLVKEALDREDNS